MWTAMRGVLTMGLGAVLVVTVFATIFLAVGTGLTKVFDVSVWEATLVLLGIAGVLFWALLKVAAMEAPDLSDLEQAETDTIVFPNDFPFSSLRRGRRRRR